jgi:hypothetical protein
VIVSNTLNVKEILKIKYWNRIPEPGTTISGFADIKKIKIN